MDYINIGRINELPNWSIDEYKGSDPRQKQEMIANAKNDLLSWLYFREVQSLIDLVKDRKLEPGSYFYHHARFYFSSSKMNKANFTNPETIVSASGHSNLGSSTEDKKLVFTFHHNSFANKSAWVQLSGRKKKIFIGIIQDIEGNEIFARPYIIGDIIMGEIETHTKNEKKSTKEISKHHSDISKKRQSTNRYNQDIQSIINQIHILHKNEINGVKNNIKKILTKNYINTLNQNSINNENHINGEHKITTQEYIYIISVENNRLYYRGYKNKSINEGTDFSAESPDIKSSNFKIASIMPYIDRAFKKTK